MMKLTTLIIVLVAYLLGNAYIFYRTWQVLPLHNGIIRGVLIGLAILLVTSMFLSFMLSNVLPGALTSLLYAVGTSWIIVFFYLLLALLLRDLVLLADRYWHVIPLSFSGGAAFKWVTYLIAVGVVSVVLFGGYVRYCVKERVELSVHTGKVEKGVRIVAITDLHLGYGIGNQELKHWVKLINAEKPDIVLITGDIVDNSIRPLEKVGMDEWLRQIKAPLGVYACPGNHEYISGVDRSLAFLKQANIQLLRDSVALVDDRFYIIGRDDRTNRNRASLQALMQGLDATKPVIVLDHQPYHLEEAEEAGVDLQLSGHTHRGQVWPFSWVTDRMYELSHGHKQKGNTHFYVSSGLGLWGGKFRIGTQSEYVVITLK